MQSQLFSLVKNDYVKGFLMAIIGAVLTAVYTALTNGSGIDWKAVGAMALTSGLSYLIKNFFSDSQGKVFGIIG